jgi:hypothetical protein
MRSLGRTPEGYGITVPDKFRAQYVGVLKAYFMFPFKL